MASVHILAAKRMRENSADEKIEIFVFQSDEQATEYAKRHYSFIDSVEIAERQIVRRNHNKKKRLTA